MPLRISLPPQRSLIQATSFQESCGPNCSEVHTDSDDYPSLADQTGDFVYARLMRASARFKAGYAPKALDAWADRLRAWSAGADPDGLPRAGEPAPAAKAAKTANATKARPRDVYAYFINGAKERAPAAARALIERL